MRLIDLGIARKDCDLVAVYEYQNQNRTKTKTKPKYLLFTHPQGGHNLKFGQ